VGQHVLALTRALLSQAKHEYMLFVLENDRELFEFATERARVIPVPEIFRNPISDIFWHQMILPGKVKKLGLDVLHTPSYRRMLWRHPCPLVATIHDVAPFVVAGKYS